MAHIIAFSEAGPRGSSLRPKDINSLENLMLLCPQCHKLIDDEPDKFPVTTLRQNKEDHENRIRDVTGAGPELRTEVIQLKGRIGGQPVDIPAPHVREAVLPRYVADQRGHVIDIAACLTTETEETFKAALDIIRHDLRVCFGGGIDGRQVRHFSVFALAPIPVLIAFGRELGDKINTDLFQRHRDHSWNWKKNGQPVKYRLQKNQIGSDPHLVALVLSLSVKVQAASLPTEIDRRFSVYEITLEGIQPNREYLNLREDLSEFRRTYQAALAEICREHVGIKEIQLFPAVPAPVAIACGQELLPKGHPDLVVFDFVKGTYLYRLRVNSTA